MSTPTTALDAGRLVEQLCQDGVPEAMAYALVRLAADVQHPGFDREIAHQDLVMVGFTSERTDELIKGPVRGSAGSRPWWVASVKLL
jgi:hypothetical protein